MSNPVPFFAVGPAYDELAAELDAAYRRVMGSGWYLLGPELEAFEAELAAHCGARHAVGVGSGLDALRLALEALDIGPGDEVLVPSHTFIATWMAVTAVGAVPVPVEPREDLYTLDPAAAEAAVTVRTRAVMPVHLYGQSADLDPLRRLAQRHGLALVEDAAQAHGATYRGKRIGSGPAPAVCFSFYPTKNLGAFGDGGAVVTDDGGLAARLRKLRNYGSDRKYHHDEAGLNSRLDELQAAFLRVKLPHLETWNGRRRDVARRYLEGLDGIDGLVLPRVGPHRRSAWHLFVVRHPRRDDLQRHLDSRGIGTLIHYPIPPHRTGAARAWGLDHLHLPVAERLAAEVLTLPLGPHLPPEQAEAVVAAVQSFSP